MMLCERCQEPTVAHAVCEAKRCGEYLCGDTHGVFIPFRGWFCSRHAELVKRGRPSARLRALAKRGLV